jgi:hypothetical protein
MNEEEFYVLAFRWDWCGHARTEREDGEDSSYTWLNKNLQWHRRSTKPFAGSPRAGRGGSFMRFESHDDIVSYLVSAEFAKAFKLAVKLSGGRRRLEDLKSVKVESTENFYHDPRKEEDIRQLVVRLAGDEVWDLLESVQELEELAAGGKP